MEDEDVEEEEVQNQGKGRYVANRSIKNHSSGGNRVVMGGIVVSPAGAVGKERWSIIDVVCEEICSSSFKKKNLKNLKMENRCLSNRVANPTPQHRR
jgi:hypothetical protein